jgi:hypothetical protein
MSKDNNDCFGLTPAAVAALIDDDMGNFVAAATPGGIEAQEARGQADFAESQTLPIEGLQWRFSGEKYSTSPKEYLESLGFVFGEEADELFINVKFPEGWKIEPTDHSMWSDLVDDKGRNRAGIFYKAAFYDRNAHFDLNRRYSYSEVYDHMEDYIPNTMQYFVRDDGDNGKILYETEAVPYKEKYEGDFWDIQNACEQQAINWLNENYPEWESPLAYWDD